MPRGSGRRPKPTAIKKRDGNPGNRPLNENEPVAPAGEPEMPEGLPAAARQEWDRIIVDLRQLNVLSTIDRAALGAYCFAYARWFEAELDVKKYGRIIEEPVIDTKTGRQRMLGRRRIVRLKKNPAISISNEAQKLMKSFLIEFGMTPAARSRLVMSDDAKKKADPAEKYFGGDKPRSSPTIQ